MVQNVIIIDELETKLNALQQQSEIRFPKFLYSTPILFKTHEIHHVDINVYVNIICYIEKSLMLFYRF